MLNKIYVFLQYLVTGWVDSINEEEFTSFSFISIWFDDLNIWYHK